VHADSALGEVTDTFRLTLSNVLRHCLWPALPIDILQVSNTYQEINIMVYELVPHAVSEEERHPTLFNKCVHM